jgi:glyoxylate utilization-related uncharacterized protein
MTELFGTTRNVVKGRYALLTPDTLVPSHVPAWENMGEYEILPYTLAISYSYRLSDKATL